MRMQAQRSACTRTFMFTVVVLAGRSNILDRTSRMKKRVNNPFSMAESSGAQVNVYQGQGCAGNRVLVGPATTDGEWFREWSRKWCSRQCTTVKSPVDSVVHARVGPATTDGASHVSVAAPASVPLVVSADLCKTRARSSRSINDRLRRRTSSSSRSSS